MLLPYPSVREDAAAMAPRAVVMGTIDLVRPLGLAGIRCAVVARPTNVAAYSRFTDALIEWSDPAERPDQLVERLIAFARRERRPPILFYEGDAELLAISRARERLEPLARFLMPDRVRVEELVDKARFRALAERLDLRVPRTVPLDGSDGDPTRLRFPLIVKPVVRTAAWAPLGDGAKAIEVATAGELEALVQRLPAGGADLLAQELIDGPETRIETYHVYVDREGEIVADFAGRKIRTRPARYGHSTAVLITEAADVLALGRKLTPSLEIRGVAKLDFKRDDAGRLWLLEVNPRFNLWHHPAARAGLNLPDLVYRDLAGLPRPRPSTARPGVRWMHRDVDARAAREAGVPFRRWLRWALACEARSGLSIDDPAPAVRGALMLLSQHVADRRSGAERA
jgi:predicted ATP-grasp superfamily ATP-dependent carboligase